MLLGKLGDHVLSDSSFVYSKASRVSGGGSARMVEEGEGGRGSGRRGGSGSGSGMWEWERERKWERALAKASHNS